MDRTYTLGIYHIDDLIEQALKTEVKELVEDLIQIITVFSCKLQGKRAGKARKLVKELIEEGDENDKNNKGNVDTQ